jgi:hypothetical protein
MAMVAMIVMAVVAAVTMMVAVMRMRMFAVDVGIAAKALEDLGAEQPGDERAEERQEDDGG